MADEKDVETYLIKQVEKRGGMCVKFPPLYFAGFPDRILVMPNGVTVYVEVKAPHITELDPLQKIVARKLKKRGQWVEMVNSEASIDALLKRVTVW